MIVPVVQHLILCFCDLVFYESDRLFVLRRGFLGMLGYLCILLILATSYIYKKGKYEVNELEKRADAAEQKYRERIEGDRERDILVHDIRNHLIVIDSILQDGEVDRARNYIGKLQEDYCNIRQSFHTGSVVVDAILGSKAYQAENAGIRFKIVSDDLSDSFVSDRDWCSILSNLLDNAIEACEKMEGKGWIRVRLENRPFGMVWIIENTCPELQDDRTEAKPKRRGGPSWNRASECALCNPKVQWVFESEKGKRYFQDDSCIIQGNDKVERRKSRRGRDEKVLRNDRDGDKNQICISGRRAAENSGFCVQCPHSDPFLESPVSGRC